MTDLTQARQAAAEFGRLHLLCPALPAMVRELCDEVERLRAEIEAGIDYRL